MSDHVSSRIHAIRSINVAPEEKKETSRFERTSPLLNHITRACSFHAPLPSTPRPSIPAAFYPPRARACSYFICFAYPPPPPPFLRLAEISRQFTLCALRRFPLFRFRPPHVACTYPTRLSSEDSPSPGVVLMELDSVRRTHPCAATPRPTRTLTHTHTHAYTRVDAYSHTARAFRA